MCKFEVCSNIITHYVYEVKEKNEMVEIILEKLLALFNFRHAQNVIKK